MTYSLLGFVIALAVGLTGIGGGSFTVPALLLIAGLPASEAVGTTFVFAGVLRLIAAPFYLANRQVHAGYFWLLVQGAVPGLVLGMIALRALAKQDNNGVIVIVLGLLLTVSSIVTFVPRAQAHGFARKNSGWLPWLAFPIGLESGFSSAGAGALGTVLLLNYSEMSPAQVVGTDLMFGLVLAVVGTAVHWTFGSISTHLLAELLLGGIPGVVLGCVLARLLPARRLKAVVATIAICAGLQLVRSGARTLANRNNTNAEQYKPSIDTPVVSNGAQSVNVRLQINSRELLLSENWKTLADLHTAKIGDPARLVEGWLVFSEHGILLPPIGGMNFELWHQINIQKVRENIKQTLSDFASRWDEPGKKK